MSSKITYQRISTNQTASFSANFIAPFLKMVKYCFINALYVVMKLKFTEIS